MEKNDPALQHQIICAKCGMVYELRYIAEHCRKADGDSYICLNCNAVLDLKEES